MADVTGRIGNEEVELNNAATEATLKMLLQATLAAAKGSKDELNKIAAMAAKAGLDSDSIEQTNRAVQATTPQMNALGKSAFIIGAAFGAAEKDFQTLVKTGQQLAAGTAQASDVLSNMATMLPGPLGKVVQGFAALAAFQETQLTQYQTLTKAGVNFGGSLTDLRLAASNTYMTMKEFSDLMKVNSDVFSRMGGSTDQAARSFVNASNALQKNEMGSNLRALGLTSQEVNQGMLDYISITGGRTRAEMQNTAQLSKSTTAYLTELDSLAQITGKTKEEQEKALKEAAANAAFEAFIASLSPEEAEKAIQGVNEAFAKGGKGAQQAFMAAAQGLPPMTKEAQQYTAIARNMNGVTMQQASMIKDSTKTLSDMKNAGNAYSAAAVQDKKTIQSAGSAIINSGGEMAGTMSNIFRASTQAIKQGTDTVAGANKLRQEVEQNQIERTKSQAAAAVESKKALEEIGQKLLAAFMPVIQIGLKVVNALAPFIPAIMGAVAAFAALKGAMAASALLGGGGGGIPGVPGGGVAPGAAGGLGGMGAAMRGAAGGLRAFANPMVLAGAAGFGVAIAAIGAGIAGAGFLMGKALPTLAEGLMKFTEIDGTKLGSAAFGVAKLGVGLLPLAPFAIWGLPAAFAMNQLADGVGKMAAIDPGRLEKVAAGMEKIKAATPSVGESVRAGIAGLVGKVTNTADATPATVSNAASGGATSSAELINLINEIKRLNSISSDTLRYIKDTADHTKRTVDAINASSGNLFQF